MLLVVYVDRAFYENASRSDYWSDAVFTVCKKCHCLDQMDFALKESEKKKVKLLSQSHSLIRVINEVI